MAVRSIKRTNRQAIPRRDLQGSRIETLFDNRNNPIEQCRESFTVRSCTIQPASGADLYTLDSGYKQSEAFNIFTETPLRVAQRGTDFPADEVYIEAPYTTKAGWFVVVRSKPWQNGIILHYHVLVVRKNPD